MITSTGNAKVRELVQLKKSAKARRKAGVFPAEGLRLFEEIPGERIRDVYVSESFLRQQEERICRLREDGFRPETVSDDVFSYLSDTQTPQGILSVVRMLPEPEETFYDAGGIWLILENLQDPGNLGTMFRTGEGAGITGIIMDRTCTDVYSPKVIRSTMGSIFRVPFLITSDLSDPVRRLKEAGTAVYAAAAGAQLCYDRADFTRGCAFLIGNEGSGLSREAFSLADTGVYLPMEGKLESLNAAVAASLLMYEAGRQRRNLCFDSGQKK